ncbi:MAG: sporulation protein YqfD [Ruminiclostridium sp.]
MRKKYHGFTASYIRITGLGGFQEKFISELISENINIYEITQEKSGFIALVKPYDYLTIARIAKKYGIRLRVSERIGLRFRLYPLRKRWGLIIGSLCCCAVITILSQFIWKIDIEGNVGISSQEISAVMEANGLMPGCTRKSFDTKICELSAMSRLESLSWISVEREGSKVYIKVAETNDPDNSEIPVNTPCNVISDYDGQLVYTEIYKGRLQTTVGSGVVKGQLLISGTVNDNGGHIVYVHADGIIKAVCEQTEEFYLPFEQERIVPTDTKYYSTYFMLGSYSLALPWEQYHTDDMSNMSYSEDTYKISLFGIETPYNYKRGVYTQLKSEKVVYKNSDVIHQLEQQKEDFEANFLSDCKIMSDEKEFEADDKGIKMTVKYKVERNIGVKREIGILH